jgi:mRNA interferase RelE/StbE
MTCNGRYQVKFTKSARKEFERLPDKIQDRVVEALFLLAENPFSKLLRIKKLSGVDELYRIRIGDYRLVYTVEADELILILIKIGHRREVYRRR